MIPPPPPPVANPLGELKLRCNSCGAPYSNPSTQEILTCGYCGTTQRVVDARQFLDYFTSQVTAFLRQAVPPGLDVTGSSTVDPIARLSAFNSSVRPHLSTESDQYRFALFNLLSNPFVVLPFVTPSSTALQVNPAAISMFVAKVQSVSGLAVDEASRELLAKASGVAAAYQSLLVAMVLLQSSKAERYHLAVQNLVTAADSLKGVRRWAPLANRLSALAKQAEAVDKLLSGSKPADARPVLGRAGQQLSESSGQVSAIPEIGFMVTPIEQELAAVRTLASMVSLVESSQNVSPHPLAYLQRLGALLDWLSRAAPTDWATSFRSMRLWEEVFTRAAELRSSQAGAGSVRVLTMGAGVFFPFWKVELPYTFETGALWAKHGKEVSETLLVSATFPTDLTSLDPRASARVLTDVFSASRAGGQFYSRLAGKEQKITESGGLAGILQNAASSSLAGRPAVPPLTTSAEASRLVQSYLNIVRTVNPKAAAQLRASSPRVVELVYIPCTVPSPAPIPWLGPLSPASIGDPQSLLSLAS